MGYNPLTMSSPVAHHSMIQNIIGSIDVYYISNSHTRSYKTPTQHEPEQKKNQEK